MAPLSQCKSSYWDSKNILSTGDMWQEDEYVTGGGEDKNGRMEMWWGRMTSLNWNSVLRTVSRGSLPSRDIKAPNNVWTSFPFNIKTGRIFFKRLAEMCESALSLRREEGNGEMEPKTNFSLTSDDVKENVETCGNLESNCCLLTEITNRELNKNT